MLTRSGRRINMHAKILFMPVCLQGSEDVVVDGVEDAIWAKADSVVVGYNKSRYLTNSGWDLWDGQSVAGDSANAVAKFLYKPPYLYLLFKMVDKSVGGRDWSQFDAIIMAFKQWTADHSWVQPWDKRIEHFYTYGWLWAADTTVPPVGAQPLFKGNDAVAGGSEWKRNAAQKDRWQAVTTVLGGVANDTLPDEGWISEHRIRVDSLGFNTTGDILPFSFCIFDADRYLDSNKTNNSHTRTWWGTPWNENWYYNAIYIDPNVTTSTPGPLLAPVDYTIPRLRSTAAAPTIDGNLADWQMDNSLHFRAKWGDDAGFDSIRGTGDWSSGWMETDWNNYPTVVDGPEVEYHVTYDDANLYVAAKVTDQIVTIPGDPGRKDGISLFILDRTFIPGTGISPKTLTVNIDSSGNGVAADDLISLADTAGVTYSLKLANGTNVNDIADVDSGYTVELKIPFAALHYPASLGDSVVFLAGSVHDIDIFDDVASNYYAKTWWFKGDPGQESTSWTVLGPALTPVGVKDKPPIPTSIKLYANYPNPFNPTTTIKYSVTVNAEITLSVYNTLGQAVSVMKKTNVPAGYDEFKFDAGALSSGVYFYQLKVTNLANHEKVDSKVNKMIVLK